MKKKTKSIVISQTPESTQSNSIVPSQYSIIDNQSDIEDFEDEDDFQQEKAINNNPLNKLINNDVSTKKIQPNDSNKMAISSPIEGFSDDDELGGTDDSIFFNQPQPQQQQQPIQRINLANFHALEGLKNWRADQSRLDDDEEDMEDGIHKQTIQDERSDDNVKKSNSWMDIILSDDEDIDNININNDKYSNNENNISTNNNYNNNNNNNNKINSNAMNNNIIKSTINANDTQRHEQSGNILNMNNSQCLSDIISDSQTTFDDEDTPSTNSKYNSNNSKNNNENIQISTFIEKHKRPLRQSLKKQTAVSIQQQSQQQTNVYNQPTFSLVSSNESDTLIELKNLTDDYSFKKDGLASAALGYIKSETSEFQKWQQSVKIAMAKHGSVAKIWKQWKDTRLCRLINVWNENGMILGWCVDMNKEEEEFLTNSYDQNHGNNLYDNDNTTPKSMMATMKDTISEINSQPMIPLPTYESNGDNRQPYLCMFSFVYDLFHSKSSQTKLLNAEYLAIWPPWTAIPITLNNEVYHVHIITRFILDDYF
ncbi:hypothetical protein BJ944DRAFT_232598 [Cunninghamella echinulata]|nr:hypothetical protein BJ944DRAFT_232598 [Cunninghamella echinulata]